MLTRKVEQMRRRILGGSGGGGSGTMEFVGEFDPTRIYSLLQICIISAGSNAGTFVFINNTPSSGHAPYAGGGYFVQLPMGTLGAWM